ncbi:MAG TPA: Uma2 family endonuclease [Chthonomonadaceae bacterium]|nr:Uma2 family endonuclease [Chthonomonadaceae bacterium]
MVVAEKVVPRISPQEYLAHERKAETKSEYHGGRIVAMAGASKGHNRITVNLIRHLANQLEGTSCEPFANDLRVRVPACDKYDYPDVAVVCGEPQFEDSHLDTLLNPTLIIEVLSDTTEAADRGEKFACYRTLASLTTYVLVAQKRPSVEVTSGRRIIRGSTPSRRRWRAPYRWTSSAANCDWRISMPAPPSRQKSRRKPDHAVGRRRLRFGECNFINL